MNILCIPIFFFSVHTLLFQANISFISASTVSPSLRIKDGQFLITQSETFKLGFFSPSNSSKSRYLGIWYNKIPVQTVVWVANRESPLRDLSGVLMISSTGSLVIQNRENHTIWRTNTSKTVGNPIVEFLESGNLVLRESNSNGSLWESFDYPSDTLLPGMKLGWNLKTGLNRNLSSWKSLNDPSPGDYTRGIDLNGGYPELVMRNGTKKYYSGGPWNGNTFSGIPELKKGGLFKYDFVQNETEVYYNYHLLDPAAIFRVVVNASGKSEASVWMEQTKSWFVIVSFPDPKDPCDDYDHCGANSICHPSDAPNCRCMDGFKPRSPNAWNKADWSQGCQRMTPSECDKDGFVKFTAMKPPDTISSWTDKSMNLEECRGKCLKNCSCMAYNNLDIRGSGSGCAMWFGDLIDIRQLSDGAGQDLYIRTYEIDTGAPKETKTNHENRSKQATRKPILIILPVVSTIFLLGLVMFCIWRKKILKTVQNKLPQKRACEESSHPGENKDNLELTLFDMDTIAAATYNFSDVNMLGQGGFGCVYKGTFEDGQNIAVKRLSKSSVQGVVEFKNEVMLIARLQHRNLVRLLGSCIEGDEKMLVYEYMENKGLDSILFDKANNIKLDWPMRFNIIVGISRGLLYLHQDSRLRIVHRDLKAGNVLLDGEMTPKISDFGMARIFGGHDSEGETKRVVGTYGYMSPEYAMHGLFSVKSDVYSFGVLVLEIISGCKNNTFFCSEEHLNLLGYAWKLWKDRLANELIDDSMEESCLPNEALRCIQVGLLCIQECAEDRPIMSSVVLMLSSDSTTLPQPKRPGFCHVRSPFETDSSSIKKDSVNHLTVTMLEGR